MTEREIDLTDAALRARAMTAAHAWLTCWPGVCGVYAGPAIYESLGQAFAHFTEMICDAARRERAERTEIIMRKCEQYWNVDGLGDPEIHAILEFIHQHAAAQGETR